MGTYTVSGWMGGDASTGNKTSQTGVGIGGPLQRVKRALTRSYEGKMERNRILALTGAAVGAASKQFSYNRIVASAAPGVVANNGGARSIETIYDAVNSVRTTTNPSGIATTAADLSQVDGVIGSTSKIATYPADKSGVPAGGRAGRI